MPVWADLVSLGQPDWALRFDTGETSTVFTIGRHPSCTLVLNDMHISSKHVTLRQRTSSTGVREVIVEDSSSNGTWIDGERLDRDTQVRLGNGQELAFPSEDNERENYTFTFSVLIEASDLAQHIPVGIEVGLSSEEASFEKREQRQSSDQWLELNKLQQQLLTETSRLAASIYANDTVILNVKREIAGKGGGAQAQLAGASENMLQMIQSMVASMRRASDAARRSPNMSENDRKDILDALQVDQYQSALDAMLSVQQRNIGNLETDGLGSPSNVHLVESSDL